MVIKHAYYENTQDTCYPDWIVCSNCHTPLFRLIVRNGYITICTLEDTKKRFLDQVEFTSIPSLCPKCLSPLQWKNNTVHIN